MRYLKAIGIGVLAFLFLNGIQAVYGNKETTSLSEETIVYVDTADETLQLQNEVNRLQALSNIREVLEVNFRNASIEEKRELAETIYEACTLFDLDVELVLAVIQTESSFNTEAVSHKGALGLMQLMPRTGWAMSEEIQMEGIKADSLFDVKTNVFLGTYYLKKLLNRYNNLEHALVAYNAGPTLLDSVMARDKMLPMDYANKVQKHMKQIEQLHFSDSNQ